MAKVAVVCFGILTIGLAVTMSVDAYRSKFFQTVQELLGDSALHTYDTNEDEQGFVPHEPTYIPEGYVEVRKELVKGRLSLIYENQDNEYIYWDQIFIQEGEQFVFDVEYDNVMNYKTDDGIVHILYYDDGFVYAYKESGNYIYILDADYLDSEEVINIFNNIEK